MPYGRGMDEVQEAAVLEQEITALGANPTARQLMDVFQGYSDSAVQIALKRTGGGAPGGGVMQSAAVTLDHDDILALSNGPTAFQLVAAPAAGSLILPFHVVLVADTTAGGYTTFGPNGQLQVGLDDEFGAYSLTTTIVENIGSSISNLLGAGTRRIALVSVAANVPASASTTLLDAWALSQSPADYDGQALMLAWDNGGQTLDGGNAANTLTVTTYYTELDL